MLEPMPAGGENVVAARRIVIGAFGGRADAEGALNGLREAGFAPDQVSVAAKDGGEAIVMVERTGPDPEQGAGAGALLGGLTGGALGWLVGIGALAIPGIGPIVAAGALATALGGAVAGAATGGFVGGLAGLGIPGDEARRYEEHVRRGGILLTVYATTDERAQQAHAIFAAHGGADVRAYGQAAG